MLEGITRILINQSQPITDRSKHIPVFLPA